MEISVNVIDQKLKITTNLKRFVSGTQEFIRFRFNLSDDWSALKTFAQFQQNGIAYNQYLDENNCVYLPSEITEGFCVLMLYGNGGSTIATTNYLTLTIDANILISDANSTNISLSLYDQLIAQFDKLNKNVDNCTLIANAAMQPDIYDPQGMKTDIFAHIQHINAEMQMNVGLLSNSIDSINDTILEYDMKLEMLDATSKSISEYGYGSVMQYIDGEKNDFITIIQEVYNTMLDRTSKQIAFSDSFFGRGVRWWGVLWRYTSSYGMLYARTTNGLKVQRMYKSGEWGAWEYDNPPMSVDVEYRTTERWMSKPVYAKLIDLGTANGATFKIIKMLGVTNIVRAYVQCGDCYGTYNGDGTNSFTYSIKLSSEGISIFTDAGNELTGQRMYATVYYITSGDTGTSDGLLSAYGFEDAIVIDTNLSVTTEGDSIIIGAFL